MSNSSPLGNLGIPFNGIGGPLGSLGSVGSGLGGTGAAASAPLSPEKVIALKGDAKRLEKRIADVQAQAVASKKGMTPAKEKWLAEALQKLEKIQAQLDGASAGGSDSFTALPTPTQALKGVQRGGATPDASWNRQTAGVFEAAIEGLGHKSVSVAQLRDSLMKA